MGDFGERCSQYFDEADIDGKGTLSKFELYKVVAQSGCDAREATDMFEELDTNDDNAITKDEFMHHMTEKIPPQKVKEADLRCAFKKLDPDESGVVSREEMEEVCGLHAVEADFDKLDTNDDGKISFEEFLADWKQHHC